MEGLTLLSNQAFPSVSFLFEAVTHRCDKLVRGITKNIAWKSDCVMKQQHLQQLHVDSVCVESVFIPQCHWKHNTTI